MISGPILLKKGLTMKKTITLLFLFVFTSHAQDINVKSAFVSVNVGGFLIANNGFEKVYDSKLGFAPGISLGLPLSTHMYLCGKATYFFKNGVPVVSTYSYSFQDSTWTKISERKEGTARFREWIFNAGLLYNFFLSKEYTLGINGGATLINLYENRESANSGSSTLTGGGLLGYFGGAVLERNFENSPFTAFAEVQYNFSRNAIKAFVGDYGGLNLTAGVRYYFKKQNKQ